MAQASVALVVVLAAGSSGARALEPVPIGQEARGAAADTDTTHPAPDSLPVVIAQDRIGGFLLSDVVASGPGGELSGEYTLGDLLDRLPGVRMIKLGPLGSFETPVIACKTGNAVQTTVDGTAYLSKDYRGPDFNDIPPATVSEIRIDRSGGHVHLLTGGPCGTRPLTWVRVQRGSRGLSATSVMFSRKPDESTRLRLGAFSESLRDRPRNTDLDQHTYTAHVERLLHRGQGLLDFSFLRAQTDAGLPRSTELPIDAAWTAKRREMRHRAVLKYGRVVAETSMLSVSGWMDLFSRRVSKAEAPTRNDRILGTSLTGNVLSGDGQLLTIRAEADHARYEADKIRETIGRVLVRDTYQLAGQLRAQASGRLEHSPRHGWIWQARLRLGQEPPGLLTWRLDLDRDARFPTFDEEFRQGYERADTTFAVRLRPEQRIGLHAGAAVCGAVLQASSHVFFHQVRDWIGPKVTSSGPQYDNRRELRAGGVENALSWRPLRGATLEACHDWCKGEAADGEPLLHWPEHRASVSLRYSRSHYGGRLALSAIGSATYVSGSRGATVEGVVVDLGQAILVHAELGIRLLDFSAFYGVRNALDDTAACWYGYPREGRAFRWGMHWNLWD